jgi:hypothetical protein
MQFPFAALDNGAIAVRRPLSRRMSDRELIRIPSASSPLVAACRQAATYTAWESVIWITLFASALILLAIGFAL